MSTSVRERTRTEDPSPSGHGSSAGGELNHVQPTAQSPERLTLRANEFELLDKAEADAFLAARYCSLTEAGWPPVGALALAMRTEIDLKDAPSYRAAYAS